MKLATYNGVYARLRLGDGRVLVRGEPTEVTEEQARYLTAESRAYLGVTIADAPDAPAPTDDDDQEAEA